MIYAIFSNLAFGLHAVRISLSWLFILAFWSLNLPGSRLIILIRVCNITTLMVGAEGLLIASCVVGFPPRSKLAHSVICSITALMWETTKNIAFGIEAKTSTTYLERTNLRLTHSAVAQIMSLPTTIHHFRRKNSNCSAHARCKTRSIDLFFCAWGRGCFLFICYLWHAYYSEQQ